MVKLHYIEVPPWYKLTLEFFRQRVKFHRDNDPKKELEPLFECGEENKENAFIIHEKIESDDNILFLYEKQFLTIECKQVFPGLYFLPYLPTFDQNKSYYRWFPGFTNTLHPKNYFFETKWESDPEIKFELANPF